MKALLLLSLLLPIWGAPYLQKVKSAEGLSERFKTGFGQVFAGSRRSDSCFLCSLAVDGVQTLITNNATDNEITAFLIQMCDLFNFEQPYVCYKLMEGYEDEFVFVLSHTLFTPDEICGALVQNCGTSINPLNDMWNITIPGNKPPVKPWPTIPDGKPTYKVLHLSDIHIDRSYAVGSEAYCQLDQIESTYSLCCRNYPQMNGTTQKDKPIHVPAGQWGMPYVCDIPYKTFDNAMKHISQNHKDIDYIILTGDFEAHDNWDYTQQLTIKNVDNITAALLHYFPKTPIYVSIGNHEGVPQDAMAPHGMPEYDTRGPQWLYTEMNKMWSNWLPDDVKEDVQYRASYATYVKPELKLISINSVYCSHNNYYLFLDQVDPDATLAWLIDQLSDSEAKGEKVHIISHIPPGSNYCLKGWAFNFFDIVHRFESTIAQLFFGHTHQDHFQVYYDPQNASRPFHFNWIAPSLTTFGWNNPAYRIYTIDGGYEGATYTVKEAQTYSTDLEQANESNKEPVWSLEYDTKQAYNMTAFTPQTFSDLSDRLWNEPQVFKKFMRYYYRNEYNNECYMDTTCRRGFVCDLKEARSYDETFCIGLK